MSGTVTPVEVPRETIEAWCREIGFPGTADLAIRRATESGMLKLIEVEECSQTEE